MSGAHPGETSCQEIFQLSSAMSTFPVFDEESVVLGDTSLFWRVPIKGSG